ncbi:MAG TPA: hypothetical protein VMX12_12030 [Acidimicrobiia bacterium]|nr:hypothetical protein [Acidimicrobiia bacterium]
MTNRRDHPLRDEEYKLVAQMMELRGDMARGFQTQTWRLLGAIFVAFGLFATLVRVS